MLAFRSTRARVREAGLVRELRRVPEVRGRSSA